MQKKIAIIVPVYNENNNVSLLVEALQNTMQKTVYDYAVYLVDDGSKDDTMDIVKSIAATNHKIKYLSFSKNFGKDNALMAGLQFAEGDAVITMDADLQHPPELIVKMLDLWEDGNEVVYTFRDKKNEHVSGFSRMASGMFYKAINELSDVELEDGISDFRLLDKKIVAILNNMKEDKPFLRGLIKWIGFKQTGIPYTPAARASGTPKYSKKALLRLALQGITSFSTKPLLVAIYIGFISALASTLYIPYVIFSILFEHPISGWSSVIVSVAFFGGLQLITMGIIGIYLGKLFMQNKQRPQYIIKESNI